MRLNTIALVMRTRDVICRHSPRVVKEISSTKDPSLCFAFHLDGNTSKGCLQGGGAAAVEAEQGQKQQ